MNHIRHFTLAVALVTNVSLSAHAQQPQAGQNPAPAPAPSNQTNLIFGPNGIIPTADFTHNTFTTGPVSNASAVPNPDCRRFNVQPHTNPFPARYGGKLPSNVQVLPGAYTNYGNAPSKYVTEAPGWQTTVGGPLPSYVRPTNSWGFTYGGKTPDFIRFGDAPPAR